MKYEQFSCVQCHAIPFCCFSLWVGAPPTIIIMFHIKSSQETVVVEEGCLLTVSSS
jgi:hypothetical protein